MEGSITKGDERNQCGSRDHYVPVDIFNAMAENYCRETVGVDVVQGFEHTDSYKVYMTNQKKPGQDGALGRIICKSI
jgi:hypothetical protein